MDEASCGCDRGPGPGKENARGNSPVTKAGEHCKSIFVYNLEAPNPDPHKPKPRDLKPYRDPHKEILHRVTSFRACRLLAV